MMRSPSSTKVAGAPSSSSSRGKTTPCCSKVGLKRGPWTPEEDELLSQYIKKEGEGRWRTLPKKAGLLRCGKSCRLRWMNYLRPSVKRGHITPDEEDLILRLHRLLGNRWSLIAGRIPGRTDNEIKNYWNTHLSKKLISQGIDPRTHKHLTNPNHQNNTHISPTKEDEAPKSSSANVGAVEENLNAGGLNITNDGGSKKGDEDGGMMNCCPDDVLSSFLNSLINEDMFIAAQNIQHPNNEIMVPSIFEELSFPFTTAGWNDGFQP